MWGFGMGTALGLMRKTAPFLLFRIVVYFGIALAYILATGTGAGIGCGVGGFGDNDFLASTTMWGGESRHRIDPRSAYNTAYSGA